MASNETGFQERNSAAMEAAGRPRAIACIRWRRVVLAFLGMAYLVLSVTSLRGDSVTVDEFGHLPAGNNILTTGDMRYCEFHPPLMNVLSALPLLFADMSPRGTLQLSEKERFSFWANGYLFMIEHPDQYQKLFVRGRYFSVATVLLLGLLLFVWARKFDPDRGETAGLLAAALVWFSPGIMAHARLLTNDAGLAAAFSLAVWGFHRFLDRPDLRRTVVCGLTLGLAQIVKFTSIYLYPLFVLLLLAWMRLGGEKRPQGRRGRARLAWLLLAAFALSLAVIWAGYLFQEIGTNLKSFTFQSRTFQRLQEVLPGRLPLPLPASFVKAYDLQSRDAEEGTPSFLLGHSDSGGRWYYFLFLIAIKTPVPLLLFGLWAAVETARGRGPKPFESLLLLLPGLVVVGAMSLFQNKQIGLRMILPAAPLFWLWTAIALGKAVQPDSRRLLPAQRRAPVLVVTGLLAWFAVETLGIHPYYLTYFNQFVGGPRRGYLYASDSNVDWGQGLIRLKKWMNENKIGIIQLIVFSRVDPTIYGIGYEVPKKDLHPGWLAVSVSMYSLAYGLNDHGQLLGMPGSVEIDRSVVGEPVAVLGNDIHVYRVPPLGGRPGFVWQ